MAASSTRLLSLPTVIKTYENWLHYGTFIHGPLKESLRDVLHNVSNDATYQGLPIRPADLYRELDQNHKATLRKLLQIGVLKQDQMLLIFPPNSKETHSDKFDVTLLAILIINCTTLTPPTTGWRDKHPPVADQSKAANVIRARELRNLFHHIDPEDFDRKTFDNKWMEGEGFVNGLGCNRYDTQALKTTSLDPTKLSVVHSLLQFLQIEQNKLKKQIDLINGEEIKLNVDGNKKNIEDNRKNAEDNKKNIEENRRNVEDYKKNVEDNKRNVEQNAEEMKKNIMEQLQHILKIETDLLGADKQICHLTEQSDELKNRIISLQCNQSGTYL